MYLVIRNDGALVANMRKSKTGSSYTRDIRQAEHYTTRKQAQRDCCVENERVISLAEWLEQ